MKSNRPLISIIVPIYNVETYLSRCIDSIIAQSYANIEIILVDDGSTDKSGKIADEYESKNKNITTIHKKNGGLSSARNAGIKKIRGEWVAFIDSDDYIEKDYIEKLFSTASANEADIATCTFCPYSDDGSSLKKVPTWPTTPLSGYDAINDMMRNKRPAYTWLNLFRVSLIKENKISFPVGKQFEDIVPKIASLYYAKKIAYINEPLYHYLIRRSSITGAVMSKKKCDDFLEAISGARQFLEEKTNSKYFVYIDYFELCSLFTLLNYLSREQKLSNDLKAQWRKISRKIRHLCLFAKFPSIKSRVKLCAAASVATSRRIYSAVYRKAKQ